MAGSGYGDCVAAPIPDGDGRRDRGGCKALVPCVWAGLEPGRGAASGVVGSGGAANGALSGVWRDAHAAWRPTACDSRAVTSTRLGLAQCLMVMGGEIGLAGLAAISGAAGCR